MGDAWYRSTYRWCQTNLTELDAEVCNVGWWRRYWLENNIQGIIVNGGGIVSYYPSANKLAYRSKFLGERDLLGEFARAARADGIRLIVRMDINGAGEALFAKHPEWFSRDKAGNPIQAQGYYYSCIATGYYQEYVPDVFKEIIERYRPDGFADNAWSGMRQNFICYCDTCRKRFKAECGLDLPEAVDWDDPVYRKWLVWSQGIRTQNWAYFNQITMQYGGQNCLWCGMLSPNPTADGLAYDLREVTAGARMLCIDNQKRNDIGGFEQNLIDGLTLHELVGEGAVVIESMANYINSAYLFRAAANPPEETRHWMRAGFAGGISPWAHFVGSKHEDARMYDTPAPMLKWHVDNEEYLYNRTPIASVGLLWSQRNTMFYAKGDYARRCAQPWQGFTRALIRGHMPFIPINTEDAGKQAGRLDVLVLPDLAALSDGQIRGLDEYVKGGGSLVVTGASGMLNEDGDLRESFPLDDLIGIQRLERKLFELRDGQHIHSFDTSLHNYMRLPEPEQRHEIFAGFDKAGLLPFGGQLFSTMGGEGMAAICTMTPPFPFYPPEHAYMEPGNEDTGIPVLLAGTTEYGGRVVYFAGDIDRRYAQLGLHDHGDVLAAAVRWAAGKPMPVAAKAAGRVYVQPYRQGGRLIVHLLNLTGCRERPGFVEGLPPIHGVEITLDACGLPLSKAELRVAGGGLEVADNGDGTVSFTVPALNEHEMVVLE